MLLRPAVVVIRRVVVALVLSVFVGVTAIAQTTPAWAVESWSTPVDLSENTQNAYAPQIVAAPNNTLTAIWRRDNGTKYVIQTRTSSDAGATWSNTAATAKNLSDDTENAGDPQIVAAPNNTLTAIWTRSNGTKIVIQTRSSSDGGSTWSSPTVDLSDDTQTAARPQIVAAPNNTLTAIWYRNNGTKWVVQTRTSSDAGATWSNTAATAENLSDDTENAYSPQIVAAPNNTLTAIWQRTNGTKYVVQTRTSSDAGATWSTVVDLSDDTQNAYSPQIVAAPNNTLTAIWYRSNGTKWVVQTRTSSDAGATWSNTAATAENLSDDTENAGDPQIVAAPNNTLTAIWTRSNGTKSVIQTRSSSDGGATWSSPTVDLSDDTQDASSPQIAAAPNNTLTAIWYRNNGTKNVIPTRTSSDGGATWSAVVDLSDDTQSAEAPQIVAAPNNTLTAIWQRTNGTKWVVQSSSLAPSSSSSSSSSASSSADAGVPGIFLTVAGPVGRSASEAPIYYGADRVAVTSTYLLTVTRVSNIAPTITTLAEGTIDADGSFFSMTQLPALTPGVYNVQMVGTHVNGSTLQLTSQITIGGVGEFTSIGANIPVIK